MRTAVCSDAMLSELGRPKLTTSTEMISARMTPTTVTTMTLTTTEKNVKVIRQRICKI